MADQHKNLAVSAVATAPSPASSGTSLVVTAGHGSRFPAPPFNATVWPAGASPDPSNAEIVRVTAISTDTLTIARTQEGTSARSIVATDQIAATITAETLTDIERVTGLRPNPKLWTDLVGTSSGNIAPYALTAVSSGTNSAILAPANNHPGVIRFTSSTTANSGVRIMTDVGHLLLAAGDYFECIFQIKTLANLTMRIGFIDVTTSADVVDGAYLEVLSTGVATFKTADNSARTSNATTATLSASVWYRVEIEVNASNDARCRIFNSDTGAVVLAEQTNTTNIPGATNRASGAGIIATNSGTTATALVDVDLIGYERRPGFDIVR